MATDYPPLSVPASSDYFLALFRLDEDLTELTADDPAICLSAWDGQSWHTRGAVRHELATLFPDHVTAAEFDREFLTLRDRTVGDVCRFLADRVPRPAVRPWLNDPAAGAFLTVRHQLAAAGADVSDVRPSAPLEPYLRRHPDAFGWRLHQLAPGLPFVRTVRPVVWAGAAVVIAGVLTLAVEALLIWRGVQFDPDVLGGPAMAACLLGTLVALVGALLPPRRVALGELRTFRDLARAVAVQSAA